MKDTLHKNSIIEYRAVEDLLAFHPENIGWCLDSDSDSENFIYPTRDNYLVCSQTQMQNFRGHRHDGRKMLQVQQVQNSLQCEIK